MAKITTKISSFTDVQKSLQEVEKQLNILNDAVKWQKLQSNKADVGKKVESARPVVKAGVKQRGTEGKAKAEKLALDKMKSTGNVDDVARYLLS